MSELHYQIDLPFPISTNRLWRASGRSCQGTSDIVMRQAKGQVAFYGGIRVHLSKAYTAWKREADALYMTQKQRLGAKTLGKYTIHCVFSSALRRPNQDGDNLTKCVNDWLQRVEIIHNDCLCEAGSWEWGLAPFGCIALLNGELYVICDKVQSKQSRSPQSGLHHDLSC
jgi:Holliday junction resolvase RusA-like endonuclease